MTIQVTHTLTATEADKIKSALLAAASQGCTGLHGEADPERVARGLIAAFRLVDAATEDRPEAGSGASGKA